MHTYSRSSVRWALLTALVIVAGVRWGYSQQPASRGDAPAASPAAKVLVLRNGQVLVGQVTPSGECVSVVLPEGEIRLRTCEVECCCDRLEDAYARLHAGIAPGSGAPEHLKLAQWCLRLGLLQQAKDEVENARTAEPKHPMLEVLTRRIEMAQKPPAATGSALPGNVGGVSADDLDRMVRGLSPGTMESYMQRVQPLLVNNCSTAACHGSQAETAFRIIRLPSDRPAGRRLTQRNLLATLELINREDPAASPLLTVPLKPHGTAKAAIFTSTQSVSYRWILEWVYQVANQPVPEILAKKEASANGRGATEPAESQPDPASRHVVTGTRVIRVGQNPFPTRNPVAVHVPKRSATSTAAKTGNPPPDSSYNPPARPTGEKGEASVAAPAAVDPFDPEVFNRRYSAERR